MFKHLKTDTFNWILIIGAVLFILELVFFHGGMIASAIFSAVLIYVGWRNFNQLWGKILFWLGIVAAIFSILNMLAVRFLILAAKIRNRTASIFKMEKIAATIPSQNNIFPHNWLKFLQPT